MAEPIRLEDIAALLGTRSGGKGLSLDKPKVPVRQVPKNEAHWRAVSQGQIKNSDKPTISQAMETQIGNYLGRLGVDPRYAEHFAERAMRALNDTTPVGNATGVDEGARMVSQAVTRGDLAKGGLGAALIALNVLPYGGEAKRRTGNWLGQLMRDESGAIRAWHGSPHDFDRFDMSKIGTGEGAQAYGHGLYFAENRDVADEYRKALTTQKFKTKQGAVDQLAMSDHLRNSYQLSQPEARDIPDMINSLLSGARPEDLANDLMRRGNYGLARALDDDALQALKRGHIYEVNINAEPGDFLNWDAPLTQGRGAELAKRELERTNARKLEFLRSGNSPWANEQEALAGFNPATSLQTLNNHLGPELPTLGREMGIPGIRYLDQGSRNALGNLTSNYVVFDDSLIDILNKF